MITEVRIYRLRPGLRSQWAHLFETEVRPFMTAQGMQLGGSYLDLEDEDVFVWFRSFDSEEERLRQYTAVYENPTWQASLVPRIMPLLDGTPVVHRIAGLDTGT